MWLAPVRRLYSAAVLQTRRAVVREIGNRSGEVWSGEGMIRSNTKFTWKRRFCWQFAAVAVVIARFQGYA